MGISGITNRGIVEQELKDEAAARSGIEEQIKSTSLEDIQSNEDLFRFAVAAGGSTFKVYCTQSHGSGAQGGPGYPNLNDDDWLWGGDLNAIYTTISYGIRNDQNEDARTSQMPAFGADGILEHAQIVDVANYVLSLSGKEHDEKAAEAGKAVFADNCAACHGEDGKGDREFGAPNLTDPIWLYGGTEKDIVAQITHPHHGVMPAWIGRLGEVRVKELAVYVHSLGGGEKAKTQ
jgi:cytochrome c oxidase cbb3-type subunit 3